MLNSLYCTYEELKHYCPDIRAFLKIFRSTVPYKKLLTINSICDIIIYLLKGRSQKSSHIDFSVCSKRNVTNK